MEFQINLISNFKLIRKITINGQRMTEYNVDPIYFDIFYVVDNVIPPYITYRYNVKSNTYSIHNKRNLRGFNEGKFHLERKCYLSEDETVEIPLYIVKKKNMKGPKPCLISVYGMNRNISIKNWFFYFQMLFSTF